MANNSDDSILNTSTTASSKDDHNWVQGLKVVLILTELIVVIVGLLGNFIVVYAFIFYKKLRSNVTNYFVTSLALSDILTTGLVTSFHLDATTTDHQWTHGEFMCSLYTTMYLLAVPSSIMNLCAVTVDRYLVLKMPFRYNSLMTPRRAVLIICCLWVYAIVWACLPVMGWKQDLPAVENGFCYFSSTKEYNVAVNVFNFYLPMIFMAAFWSLIFAIVRQHRKRFQRIERSLSLNTNESLNSSNGDVAHVSSPISPKMEKRERKRLRRNVRGSRYIGFIVILFYFCWFPYVTLSLVANLCKTCSHYFDYELPDAFLALGFLNSALNPFLYPFHDKHFKGAFKDTWRKLKNKTFASASRRHPEEVALWRRASGWLCGLRKRGLIGAYSGFPVSVGAFSFIKKCNLCAALFNMPPAECLSNYVLV